MRKVLATLFLTCLCLTLEHTIQARQVQSQPYPTSSTAIRAKSRPVQTKPTCTNNGTYSNRRGQTVPRPESCSAAPEGSTAQCRDGAYSFSRNRLGTWCDCGGVGWWL